MSSPTSSQRLARLLFGSGHHAAAHRVLQGLPACADCAEAA